MSAYSKPQSLMQRIRRRTRNELKRLWSRVPSRPWAVAFWCLGLALGGALVWSGRWLSPNVTVGLWALGLAAAAYLAWRGEPEFWTDTPLAPEAGAEPPSRRVPEPPPVIPPLLDLVEIPGGAFIMGSPPATEAEIAAISVGWDAEQARDWRTIEEPAHPVRIASFAFDDKPLCRSPKKTKRVERYGRTGCCQDRVVVGGTYPGLRCVRLGKCLRGQRADPRRKPRSVRDDGHKDCPEADLWWRPPQGLGVLATALDPAVFGATLLMGRS